MGKVHSPLMCLFILLLFRLNSLEIAQAQNLSSVEDSDHPVVTSVADPCEDLSPPSALTEALHLVCERERVEVANDRVRRAIIIGFLGGYVKRDDVKHPEVLFAKYLGWRYGPDVHSEMFGNHEGKQALKAVIRQLNKDDGGQSTSPGKVKIILYGHSWGASQLVTFARDLERLEIPVALTIQIDSVKKPRQNDHTIPANVASAVNFYQEHGLTPGQPHIDAADVTRTKILGNFHMTYRDHRIKCDNYRWLSRHFNRGHHEIENDPHVWDHIASLIESQLTAGSPGNQAAPQI
jgi:hypothetical protein